MLSLTRKTDYGLVALAYLGQRRAKGLSAASARDIAGKFNLPLPLMMNILKTLNRAGMVSSIRGVHGGYQLASDPDQVCLMDVVRVMEGPFRFARCGSEPGENHGGCCIECSCPIRGPIRRLHQRIRRFLEEMTLAELLESKRHETVLSVCL